MKIIVREYMLEMLSNVESAVQQLEELKDNKNEYVNLLGTCQDVVINIAQNLDENSENLDEVLANIDEACKCMYMLTVDEILSQEWKEQQRKLGEIIKIIKCYIKEVHFEKMKVLFLPAEADKWDSMDSIYKAVKEDERFDTIVMPVPYYEYGDSGFIENNRYDGDVLSKYVDVVTTENYDIDKEHPDVILINDPYDGDGDEIRIDPKYFSEEIVNKTECLVYVSPTLVGDNSIEDLSKLPGIKNSKKIVVQSEKEKKKLLKDGIEESKIICFGSTRDEFAENIKHEEKLNGFIDIVGYMDEPIGEEALAIVELINKKFKNKDEIQLNWYKNLEFARIGKDDKKLETKKNDVIKDFKSEKNRVFIDEDISAEIFGKANFYIGQGDSWRLHHFEKNNKPILVRKENTKANAGKDLKTNILNLLPLNYIKKGSHLYGYCSDVNGILDLNLSNMEVSIYSGDENFNKTEKYLYDKVYAYGNSLFFAPLRSKKIMEMNIVTGEKKYYEHEKFNQSGPFDIGAFNIFTVLMPRKYKDKIYYVNRDTNEIMEFENHYAEAMDQLEDLGDIELFTTAYWMDNTLYRGIKTNCLMQSYNISTAEFKYGDINSDNKGILDMANDGRFLWCIESDGLNVSLWNTTKRVVNKSIPIMDDSCGAIEPCNQIYISGNNKWFITDDNKKVVCLDRKNQNRYVINIESNLDKEKAVAFAHNDSLYVVCEQNIIKKITLKNNGNKNQLICEDIQAKLNIRSFENFMKTDTVFSTDMMTMAEFIEYIENFDYSKCFEKEETFAGKKVWNSIATEIFNNDN